MKEYSAIIKRLTDRQKARLIAASGGWNKIKFGEMEVSGLTFSDGSHGVAIREGYKYHGAPTTCFPSPLNMARSWNLSLAANTANCIGNEAYSLGINALGTPRTGVITAPNSQDNSIRFSEDPYLCGKMSAAYIRGFERNGVMADVRFTDGGQDLAVGKDEKTLREIGFMPYEMAVKEGKPTMLRIPDGELEGERLCQSRHVMSGVIGTEWQYDGVVTAENGGSIDAAKALSYGVSMLLSEDSEAEAHRIEKGLARYKKLLDDVASGSMSYDALKDMVSKGEVISEDQIDEALVRIFGAADAAAKKADSVTDSYSPFPCNHPVVFDESAHNRMAYEAACETMVLLKNKGGVLPIKREARVAFVGEYIDTTLTELGRGNGIIPMENDITSKLFSKSGLNVVGSSAGYSNISGADNQLLISSACALAKSADVVVAYVGTLGLDGVSVLPRHQLDMLGRLREESQAKLVAVVLGDTPVDMSWNDMCDAVLLAGDAGQGAARAILKILSGAVNPSGKLTESVCDSPIEAGSIAGLHGYRLYQAKNVEERYPFGFGLSYTSFEYSDLHVTDRGVRFKITNTGDMAGADTAQLYIGKRDSAAAVASKELKGFEKVFLEAGESKYVEIPFDSKSFRYYNTSTLSWECEGGTYQIYVASCSRSLMLFEEYEVIGSGANAVAAPEDKISDNKPRDKVSVRALIRTLISAVAIALMGIAAVVYMVYSRDDILRTVGIRPYSETGKAADIVLLVLWIGLTVFFAWLLIGGIERLRRDKRAAKKAAGAVGSEMRGKEVYVPDTVYDDDWKQIEYYTDSVNDGNETSDEQDVVATLRQDTHDTREQTKESVAVRKTVEGRFIRVKHTSEQTAALDMKALFGAVRAYVEGVGIGISEDMLCNLLSAMAATRTVVVRSGSSAVVQTVMSAVAECLDATFTHIEAQREDEHVTDRLISTSTGASVATAATVARNAPEKMSIALISGADTADMASYFGGIMKYTGNTASSYVVASDKWAGKTVSLPSNMWFVAVVDKDSPVCGGNACVIELYADISGAYSTEGDVVELDVYPLNVRALKDILADAREQSYLAEKYWRKIDRVEEYIGARCRFSISNRTVNAIERYAAACMSCGCDAEEAVDRVLAAFLIGSLSSDQIDILNGEDNDIVEFMDSVFGADKDDTSRELLRTKGIR